VRVSKADARVDAYGTVDELISALGFARSICDDAPIAALTLAIQRELFNIGSALATPPAGSKPPEPIGLGMVERLTGEVHRLESRDGILSDWSIPGGHTAAAAYDVARTICRRAERGVVRLVAAGDPIQPTVIAYLNRLSDLLWLFGRSLECDAGVDGSLRSATGKQGNRWSRAW
jgi:cob(I)alamin adenosyltransferase